MAFAVSGFQAISQNWIGKSVASNYYEQSTFVAALAEESMRYNKTDPLTIGRPVPDVIAGVTLDFAERLKLTRQNRYRPRIQGFETSNTKAMGAHDTRPVVANPTTRSHSQATQYAADFGWSSIETPILVWHDDLERAGDEGGSPEGQAVGAAALIEDATRVGWGDHTAAFISQIWTGSPTDQSLDPWDSCIGLTNAVSATGTYANIDRSVETSWRAQVDSSITAVDINYLLNNANITKKLGSKGGGANLCICPGDIYMTFKDQVQARGPQVMVDRMPNVGKFGFKQEYVQKDNCLITWDANCPANTVFFFTLRTWRIIFHPRHKFRVTKFVDISDKSEGAKKADQAFIETKFMLCCDNPYLNVKYTAIGT